MQKKLPPKVHVKGKRYYYVHQNKFVGLSVVADGIRELHRRLSLLDDAPAPNTMAGIFAEFADKGMTDLAPDTVHQYTYFLFGILLHRFGHLAPSEIQPTHIAQYLEKRKEAAAAVSGNRERACLSSVFEYAMRVGYANVNPCRGIRRNKERPSKVLIDSDDLRDTLDRAADHFAHVMQLAYITGIRAVDLIGMQISNVTPAGLLYTESKTKKPAVMAWTPTLRELVREIMEARLKRMTRSVYKNGKPRKVAGPHEFLLTNREGRPITKWYISSQIARLGVDWSFRHIRPKAQTDAPTRAVTGHSGQMLNVYMRRHKREAVR